MKRLITKKDLIFLGVLLAAGIALALIRLTGNTGTSARVTYDGETVEEISLDGDYYEIEVNGVTVCRENGVVYVADSSCGDKICVRSGKLTKSGDCAVCAPNRVSVEVIGPDGKKPDALTG